MPAATTHLAARPSQRVNGSLCHYRSIRARERRSRRRGGTFLLAIPAMADIQTVAQVLKKIFSRKEKFNLG